MTTPKNPLDRLLDTYNDPEVHEVSVAVLTGGRICTTTWGCHDRTLFQAASISKPVAALAALVLVHEKQLDLDEDLNVKLTSWKLPDAVAGPAKVTLRHLLCHSGALSVQSFAGYPHNVPLPTLVQTLDGHVSANNCPVRRKGPPGVTARYSGGGYTVLQLLLQDVTGLSLPALLTQKVFGPLGMSTATYTEPRVGMAKGRVGGQEIPDGWHRYPELAAAGLWCTPTDLVKFGQGIQACIAGEKGALIGQKLALDMITEQVPGCGWGLGVELGGHGKGSFFEHAGQNEGYLCQLQATVNGGNVIVVMTASDHGDQVIHPVLPQLRKILAWPDKTTYLPHGTPGDPPASFSNQAALDFAYAGNYKLPGALGLAGVSGSGTKWSLTMPKQGAQLMEPISATQATSPTLDLNVIFDLDGHGVATGLTVRQSGTSQHAARIP